MTAAAAIGEAPANRQNWATPPEFIEAIARRFGRPDFDLAASPDNAKAYSFFTEADDSLKQDWLKLRDEHGRAVNTAWINPPFSEIEPWAIKCAECRDLPRWTILLVPASIDCNWYAKHVEGKGFVMGLKGRLQFVGAPSVYPKPLMAIAYGFGIHGHAWWDWKNQK